MKLFYFYIGGEVEKSLIELHDVRFVIAEKLQDCFEDLKKTWWGTPESLHLDCWGELTSADGHNIYLRTEPPVGADRLYFVNLGGYTAAEFTELHKNVLVVAANESKAKVRALKTILDWDGHHKDYLLEVEKVFCIDDLVREKSLYIHLEATDAPTPFAFHYGYKPIGKPDYVFRE